MTRPVPGLAGIVLCGGRSSRMGTPKAWLDFGGEPSDVAVESLVPEAMKTLARADFLARLESLDADWAKRAAAAKAKGATLRYVATVTKAKITVGLQAVSHALAQPG